jgi:addiction module HigA family antidote
MKPMHPGVLVRDAIEYLTIFASKRAAVSGISWEHLDAIMAGRAPITPVIARRLGQAFGNGPELWSRLQATYDDERGLSQVTAAILDTVDGMHRTGMFSDGERGRILVRLLGQSGRRSKSSGASVWLR